MLHEATTGFPPALGDTMVRGLDEAEFCLAIAGKAVARADAAYIAGCLFARSSCAPTHCTGTPAGG